MKKLVFALTAVLASTGLAACSEKAQDETSEAAGAVGNDVEATVEGAGDAIENGADAVGEATDNLDEKAADTAAGVEADVQDESKAEAKVD